MPNIHEVIMRVDELKLNAYSYEEKARWLIELDGRIFREVMKCWGDYPPEKYPEDAEKDLLVASPYDNIYDLYLFAMIDFTNREISNYNNSAAMFDMAYDEFKKEWHRTHRPPPTGDLNTMWETRGSKAACADMTELLDSHNSDEGSHQFLIDLIVQRYNALLEMLNTYKVMIDGQATDEDISSAVAEHQNSIFAHKELFDSVYKAVNEAISGSGLEKKIDEHDSSEDAHAESFARMASLIDKLDSLIKLVDEDMREHLKDRGNPHNVTARQLGIMPGTGGGMAENVGSGLAIVSVHDDLTSIIPDDGEMYIVKYDNMPAYDENKELIITDTVRYRIFIGDGITPLSELLPITNLQSGEGTGSIVQIDPTYDKGDDRYYSPNEAPGQLSAAFGKYNKVPGKASMAVNYDNLVEAARAFAAGEGNRIGKGARSAFVAGLYNIVNALQQQAFGKFNNPDDPDALFMIGAGTGENDRKNAFTVCNDGTIKFNEKAFDFPGNEYAVKLAEEFRLLVDQLNLPANLGVDVDGKLVCNPMDGTVTENILKFYSRNGHSDVTTNGTLNTYSEYPVEDSDSDRIWAFIGTVASQSTSAGTFAVIQTDRSVILTHGYDEWAAFKIKVPKAGKYILHETVGCNKNGGTIESYIIPMTDEIRAELDPSNVETYGTVVNAGLESSPNTTKRENFKYFSDLTSVQGANPIGAIDMLIPNQSGVTPKTERIGTVELSEGEHVLILRVISTGKWAMNLFDFKLSTFEPLTDGIMVGSTKLTEAELAVIKASAGTETLDLSNYVTMDKLNEVIGGAIGGSY